MRVLISTQTYLPGINGQAVFTLRLAEGLVRAGHTVLVLTPSERKQPYDEIINGVRVLGVSALHLPCLHAAVYLSTAPFSVIESHVRRFHPEVIHIQDHYPLSAAVVQAARSLGHPVLGTNHFLPGNLVPNLLPHLARVHFIRAAFTAGFWQWMLWTFNQLDAIATPTETAARVVRAQKVRRPVTAISCGVDTAFFRPMPELNRPAVRQTYGLCERTPLLLYVGRVDREKRLDTLLQMVAECAVGSLQLCIVGNGAARRDLERLAQRLGLAGRVTFTGYLPTPELPRLLNAADVFVMPSPAELQSIATLEAMATGRPVLAANACALPELVTSGVNGELFAVGDVTDATRAVTRLLAARDQWPGMGRASLARAHAHSLAHSVNAYAALYRTVIAAHCATPTRLRRRDVALRRLRKLFESD
jgi:glycosyltransferase involved in cell wall biosynthesis